MSLSKRDREWATSASDGDSAVSAADHDSKRPRLSSSSSPAANSTTYTSQFPASTTEQSSQAHSMVALDAIRVQLQNTSDPHLQARLLLQYSSYAASPSVESTAAIDFLFSFLLQNQTQSATQHEGTMTQNTESSGAIVVSAILRGLRELLSVKAGVVEPMIQVDAMGEQLMECMSISDDFKLRRNMLSIVVDCLLLTQKFKPLKSLLATCVQDHDSGMQAICLRGYLQLHEKGEVFAFETPLHDTAIASQFDQLVNFVLCAQSDKVRILSAQVLVAVANSNLENEVTSRQFIRTLNETRILSEKVFLVLCLAGNNTSKRLVRAEIAKCMRSMASVLATDVVEHALVKTQVDETIEDEPQEAVERKTRRMMSSGVLLSLLEDLDEDVAMEASRTIARLSEVSISPNACTARWSQHVLERTITAHFDVLARVNGGRSLSLRQVLINSLRRLFTCRHVLRTPTDFIISSADVSSLLSFNGTHSSCDSVETLHVLQYCDVSSAWTVERFVDYVLQIATLTWKDNKCLEKENEGNITWDCWQHQFLTAVQKVGTKCLKGLQADNVLLDRVRQEVQRSGQCQFLKRTGQVLISLLDPFSKTRTVKTRPSSKSSLFFLKNSTSTMHASSVSSRIAVSMNILRLPPSDESFLESFKAIRQLRPALGRDSFDAPFQLVDCLIGLRQHVRSFLKASVSHAPIPLKYASMSVMLSTSPSVSTGHTNNTSEDYHPLDEAKAFTSLQLPLEMRNKCQELIDVASAVYVKAYALNASPRIELLQLIALGRLGLVVALLQNARNSDFLTENIQRRNKEAAELNALMCDSQYGAKQWFSSETLSCHCSLNDLKRAFVACVFKTWPTALVTAAIGRCTPASDTECFHYRCIAAAHASIIEPTSHRLLKPKCRKITAHVPFKQRIQFVLTNMRNSFQIYVKSVLSNGDVAYHHVPLANVEYQGPRKHLVDYTITLTVSPFSDPTRFTMAVCLGHPRLPGMDDPSTLDSKDSGAQMYTAISASVLVSITQTLR
ncbi:hypothetical protein CCR75_007124 [Bremia lactucae]|uniref:Integrator complex subunit 4/Protein SIEL C-terminal Ig-like domain-containing protein n=1 Tax=Bremia lactucae TaxID=4779 RepID=A0A976FG12_BRELC|nr:hypothetical protein CCR75_007124 [Bremia lactucae]